MMFFISLFLSWNVYAVYRFIRLAYLHKKRLVNFLYKRNYNRYVKLANFLNKIVLKCSE